MKITSLAKISLTCLIIAISSCKKDIVDSGNQQNPNPPQTVSEIKRENFWGKPWIKIGYEYVLELTSQLLTLGEINKGITVWVMVHDMNSWLKLPANDFDIFLNSNVSLSYTAIPNKLTVKAVTIFDLTNISPPVVMIYYK